MSNQQSLDKNKRRDEARARALEIQKQQERRERRSRLIILLSVIAGLAVVVALAVVILSKAPKDIPSDLTSIPSDISAPANSDDTGAFAVYKDEVVSELPADVPVFDMYIDFMCSHCAEFEKLHTPYLMSKQQAGEMVVRIHPIAILGSNASYIRGAVYAYLLGENDLSHAQQFAAWAFQNQSTVSLGESNFKDFLKNAGVSDDVASKAVKGDYERLIQAASVVTLNDESLRDAQGSFGTPALFLDDKRIATSYMDVEGFQGEVDSLLKPESK